MKFAKELEENLVAEWKEKYLDYKGGKKKLKAVSRAVRNADKPASHAWPRSTTPVPSNGSYRDGPVQSFLKRSSTQHAVPGTQVGQSGLLATTSRGDASEPHEGDPATPQGSQPRPISERSPLFPRKDNAHDERPGLTKYGSIIGSPPKDGSPTMEELQKQASLLELPDPALDPSAPKGRPSQDTDVDNIRPVTPGSPEQPRAAHPPPSQMGHTGNAYEIAGHRDSNLRVPKSPGNRSLFTPKRKNTFSSTRPFVQRMFSVTGTPNQDRQAHDDVALEAYREVDFRQAEFFQFLDKQLVKIEDFYKSKEEEAGDRMRVLREQLHVMRNRRLAEVMQADQAKNKHISNSSLAEGDASKAHPPWMAPVANAVDTIDHAIDKVRPGRIGKTSRTMGSLGTPQFPPDRAPADQRDYSRRPASNDVSYRVARRKLKTALAEYYRGLELLKSYALLNRTAFRKITKKFDKTMNARPTNRYMSEKVNKAYFVNSEVLDGMIHDVEDLYARYFERGSHKVAVGKLRAKISRAGDFTGSIWRQGVLATAGLVFGIQGLVYAIEQIWDPNPGIANHTGYLLQIYAGYFLILFLFGFFVIDARAFTQAKVNYQFVFEFDSRHMLDWRQLSEVSLIRLFKQSCADTPTDACCLPVSPRTRHVAQLLPLWWRRNVRLLAYNPDRSCCRYTVHACAVLLPKVSRMATLQQLALIACWHLPSRVPRLLSRRYVLLLDVLNGPHRALLLSLRASLESTGNVQQLALPITWLPLNTSWHLACTAVHKAFLRYPKCLPAFGQLRQILFHHSGWYELESVAN